MSEIQPGLMTYGANIHPGERWREVFDALRRHVPAIKARLSPGRPFPIGLRLSHRAASEISPRDRALFAAWLEQEGCFVPTVNAFPYGSFHGGRVKERVYLPDWRTPERAAYSIRIADLLCEWLPEGMTGSVSTVPIGLKGEVGRKDYGAVRARLAAVLEHLEEIGHRRGKKILLALEPEPGCLLETTEELCRFFTDIALSSSQRRHLAVCLDCCHQAVEFEDPRETLSQLQEAGIVLAKVQASSALRLTGPDPEPLRRWAQSCYLHQVVVRRRGGRLLHYPDLPDAIERHEGRSRDEWRCHFHLPIFHPGSAPLGTTRDFLQTLLKILPRDILLEVETYTWDVLPSDYRLGSVTESIIRELLWLEGERDAPHGRS